MSQFCSRHKPDGMLRSGVGDKNYVLARGYSKASFGDEVQRVVQSLTLYLQLCLLRLKTTEPQI